jgi:hypothetical protein
VFPAIIRWAGPRARWHDDEQVAITMDSELKSQTKSIAQ